MMDRISHLPESIAHHILSLLTSLDSDGPPVELVRMSVLSKTWFGLTASFPILDFQINKFRSRETFFKYLDYATSRFCQQNLIADKFELITEIEGPRELDVVNRCIDLVLKKGVRQMLIDMPQPIPLFSARSIPKYCLPNTLLSVSMLESLTVSYCVLPSSLMVEDVSFKSLKKLVLEDVSIDDEVIKYLTTSCPLLQIFHIINCVGFKEFCIRGHQNLQNVCIYYITSHVERIDIEAPNLSDIFIEDGYGKEALQMNLTSCKKLTRVTYKGRTLPNSNGLNDFLSHFPYVENLVLVNAYSRNKLKLSSHTLRALVLHSNYVDLADIEFNTPNLGLFIYSSAEIWNCWRVTRHARPLQTCMHSYSNDQSIDVDWFRKLRMLLDDRHGGVSNFYIHTRKFTQLERLKAIKWTPAQVQHVELHMDNHEDHADFVDAVLWCCRPQSLTLISSSPLINFEEQSDLVKITYEKLLQQEDQGHTNIRIGFPSSLLLTPLSCEGRAISFIKEEGTVNIQTVVQEEAIR